MNQTETAIEVLKKIAQHESELQLLYKELEATGFNKTAPFASTIKAPYFDIEGFKSKVTILVMDYFKINPGVSVGVDIKKIILENEKVPALHGRKASVAVFDKLRYLAKMKVLLSGKYEGRGVGKSKTDPGQVWYKLNPKPPKKRPRGRQPKTKR